MDFDARQTLIFAILTLFLGKFLNRKVAFLRSYNLPEPVTGGVLVSLLFGLLYFLLGFEPTFTLGARDSLLIVFFTTIGLNAKLSTLVAGGRPLLILLAAAVAFLVLQNLTGIAATTATGQPAALGILGGSVSLSGGHGTAIAWAPKLAEDFGIASASEIGIACATFGLVLGGVVGGPLANYLIKKHRLAPASQGEEHIVGLPGETTEQRSENAQQINVDSVLSCLLVLSFTFGVAIYVDKAIVALFGLDLPDFVVCLLAGIIMTNTLPPLFKKMPWPSGTKSLALIADLCLGLFLAMSLMTLQLWTLVDLAGPILVLLAAQVTLIILWAKFVIFRIMGKTYDAAVISAGYCGLGLGATPTAIANMSAITKKSGPSAQAFLIVPLVGAFFIDIANAFVIQTLLDWFS